MGIFRSLSLFSALHGTYITAHGKSCIPQSCTAAETNIGLYAFLGGQAFPLLSMCAHVNFPSTVALFLLAHY